MSGEQTREAELLKNHMHDLEELTKMKADNEALHKDQEHLRYGERGTTPRRSRSQSFTCKTNQPIFSTVG